MKVKVIGKTNLSGTSKKTGKDYNINMVYVTHKANGVEGESCEEIALQANSDVYKRQADAHTVEIP